MLGLIAVTAALLASACANIIVYTQITPHTIQEEFPDMPSSFGGELPGDGLRGSLIAGNPPQGCSELEKPPALDNFTGKWIVLLARYNCSFEVKVRNAQAAGYACAIVHNVNSTDLETMSAKNAENITIPSLFVSNTTGEILFQQYLYGSGFYIMVDGDPPFNINTHLLLPFAIVVVLCLLVILVFMIVKCIKDRRRARRHRLPNRCLKKIPTCKFSKGDPYETCAICLDDYLEGERLRVLPCAHAYHAKCIDPWLTQNRRVCPVCKRRVLAAGERRRRRDTDSDTDTEPLVDDADPPHTQGGTFEEQSENPFVRAARFMSRLRARTQPPPDDAPAPDNEADAQDSQSPEENEPSDVFGENSESERAPLLDAPATVAAETERRGRRPRGRRARRAAAPGPSPGTHSINAETRGEIGVAALPAVALPPPGPPHHVQL